MFIGQPIAISECIGIRNIYNGPFGVTPSPVGFGGHVTAGLLTELFEILNTNLGTAHPEAWDIMGKIGFSDIGDAVIYLCTKQATFYKHHIYWQVVLCMEDHWQ